MTKATWIYDDVKIVYSEPHIQPWESVVHVNGRKDILYYYYDMDVHLPSGKKNYRQIFGTFRRFWQLKTFMQD